MDSGIGKAGEVTALVHELVHSVEKSEDAHDSAEPSGTVNEEPAQFGA